MACITSTPNDPISNSKIEPKASDENLIPSAPENDSGTIATDNLINQENTPTTEPENINGETTNGILENKENYTLNVAQANQKELNLNGYISVNSELNSEVNRITILQNPERNSSTKLDQPPKLRLLKPLHVRLREYASARNLIMGPCSSRV